MGADYYKLLGIEKGANDDEIKKAYKKMALKWHPDRNKGSEEANQKFKQISEAFEVLSDSNKRAVYDQFGEDGLKGGGASSGAGAQGPGAGFSGFSGFPSGGGGQTFSFSTGPGGFGGSSSRGGFAPTDPNKIFEEMFGGSGIFSSMGMGGMGGGARRGTGGMGGMFGGGGDMDDDMNGHTFTNIGGMPGGMPGMSGKQRTAPSRAGTQPGFGRQGASSPKPEKPSEITRPLKVSLEELYAGTVKHLKVGRRLLNGTTEDKVLEIQIHPGWKSGTKIRFPHAGNEQAPNGDAQDLVFVVEEKQHDVFKREGNDLTCHLKIPLVEALTGPPSEGAKLTKQLTLLDGRRVQVPVPAGVVRPGQETTVLGEGMPVRKDGRVGRKGDLVVKWEVVFPERLTGAQKEGLRKVLT
ncbi:hypothetical protein B0H34DRAFT_777133 [Crassisporium funariophilum]|nr:hypothetical protein B0H34DRAFT_777133 [Crassisporium funariophilum]